MRIWSNNFRYAIEAIASAFKRAAACMFMWLQAINAFISDDVVVGVVVIYEERALKASNPKDSWVVRNVQVQIV